MMDPLQSETDPMTAAKNIAAVLIHALTFIVFGTLFCVDLHAAQKTGALDPEGKVPATFNLHYTGKYCTECHEKTPEKGGPASLKFDGDYHKLCGRCHDNAHGGYLHPVDIVPADVKIPPELPLKNGKVDCGTCHELFLQCQKSTKKLSSVRGAPYPKRSDFCFKCHDEKQYVKLNPHEQLDEKGLIIAKKCLSCHTERPDEKKAGYEDIRLIGTLNDICLKCHPIIKGNHSGNYNHFVKPSPKTLAIMQARNQKFGLILPLDESGKLTCATCHNPHQKGVIPPDRPAAKGAGSKSRFRLPGNMCFACHNI